jgi:hypothetical protein
LPSSADLKKRSSNAFQQKPSLNTCYDNSLVLNKLYTEFIAQMREIIVNFIEEKMLSLSQNNDEMN